MPTSTHLAHLILIVATGLWLADWSGNALMGIVYITFLYATARYQYGRNHDNECQDEFQRR